MRLGIQAATKNSGQIVTVARPSLRGVKIISSFSRKIYEKGLQPASFIAHNAWRLWLFGNAPGNFIRRVRNEFRRALVICLFSAVIRRD
jgi:hypothetical protein